MLTQDFQHTLLSLHLSSYEAVSYTHLKAIVVINPNNPTGAVYSKALLEEIIQVARENNLIIFADEIYDKILYDGAIHHHIAALAPDVLTLSLIHI